MSDPVAGAHDPVFTVVARPGNVQRAVDCVEHARQVVRMYVLEQVVDPDRLAVLAHVEYPEGLGRGGLDDTGTHVRGPDTEVGDFLGVAQVGLGPQELLVQGIRRIRRGMRDQQDGGAALGAVDPEAACIPMRRQAVVPFRLYSM